MAEMSREEFMRLQRDAENRMREMQRKSEQMVGKSMPPAPDFVKLRDGQTANRRSMPAQSSQQHSVPAPPARQTQSGGGFDLLRMFNFKNMSIDSDRALILAVMLLLIGESGDELLLLALIYIMV